MLRFFLALLHLGFAKDEINQDTFALLADAAFQDDECNAAEGHHCGLSALQTKAAKATATEGCSDWECTCQGVSDCYGTDYGVTWGAAPQAAMSWWSEHRCTTRPSGSECKGRAPSCGSWDCQCQGVSDCFGTIYSQSWGAAPPAAQVWWNRHGCTTRPSGSTCTGKLDAWVPPGMEGKNVWTLYHVTSPKVGPKILKEGFRPGHVGWCGGGIYFAATKVGTALKAIGVDSHQGFLIEAQVDVGNVEYKQWNCFTDPQCISTRPGLQGHLSCMSDRAFEDVASEVHGKGFNSIVFNPGDGYEVLIYNKSQVISMRHIPIHY
eukprot:TRINITY_DN14089_c0_g1_i1.p1 TRINITY_DN14089_c0_g1~~TRINITY_DN14089_c0_g1_i1.p1  ORF type:complete len:321 (+),score=42.59 TRINITY_DN14089_c0_g1_i1:52-1014(+)